MVGVEVTEGSGVGVSVATGNSVCVPAWEVFCRGGNEKLFAEPFMFVSSTEESEDKFISALLPSDGIAMTDVGASALNNMTVINHTRITVFDHGLIANISPPKLICNQEIL
jgi:hypothetical protein